MDADSCNVGRDVISIIMSLRVFYLKDYTKEVELAWAARVGPEAPESMKRIIPTLDSAVFGLDKEVYDKGSCSEEHKMTEEESLVSARSVSVAGLREHGGFVPVQGR
ncbi:hypothetical protein Q3G72_031409 [Acer saccharum]|nr:hypothetical protein Q3G72_031409 [Acer saccharum]